MDRLAAPEQPGLTLLLARDTCCQVVHTLGGLLTPPITDSPLQLPARQQRRR